MTLEEFDAAMDAAIDTADPDALEKLLEIAEARVAEAELDGGTGR